jgi:glycosyltransferase involved in cell wall biosynthesis
MESWEQFLQLSVVVPTCNRKKQLLCLLQNLNDSSYPLLEVIIVDSGEDKLVNAEYTTFKNLCIYYLESEKSVCVQRNIGIKKARGEWIFLCDDDIEVPKDYLQKLINHVKRHKEAGVVSGLVLQEVENEWKASYPIDSAFQLCWNFIFQTGIWGEINCESNNVVIRKLKQHYKQKGNHISKAGWPVVTDFSGDYFITPVYGLGASLVRKQWLLSSPYDEALDPHGIGDNFGVNMGFPSVGVHVLNDAFVYHHRGPENRLQKPLQYFRRALALDYFRRIKKSLADIKKLWLLWSLAGSLLHFIFRGDGKMIRAAYKSFWMIATEQNPYYKAHKTKERIIEPTL